MSGKRKSVEFKYVCVIQQVYSDNEYEVMGFKSVSNDKKNFKAVKNDLSTITITDIIAVLPQPTIQSDEELIIQFNFTIDVKEL